MAGVGFLSFFSLISSVVGSLITVGIGVLLIRHRDILNYVKGDSNNSSKDDSEDNFTDDTGLLDMDTKPSSPSAFFEMLGIAFRMFSTQPVDPENFSNRRHYDAFRLIVVLGQIVVISGFLSILVSFISMAYVNSGMAW